jgi:DNA-binding transcriptional LysR family regulator
VDLGLEQSFLKALRKGIVDCGVCYDYTDLYDTQKDDRFENVVFERIGTTKLSLCVMRDHPFASAASISRSDFQKKTIVIYSGTHFDDWQRVILNVLGEDLELRFHLSPIQSLQNLTKIDLKDMIYLCSRGSVSEYLLHRDDIVIIDTVDGRDLFSADAFAYLAENKAAAMLARALKDELERMASAHR